ncbi:MAG: AraC family transcriptional regulator [Planctomycetota bacterium]
MSAASVKARARTTGGRASDVHSGPDDIVAAYCAELFLARSPVIEVIRHPILDAVEIQPHAHPDLLQLTLLRSCGGRVFGAEHWVGVSGRSALVAYPKERHGYEIRPIAPDAEVIVIKLPAGLNSVLRKSKPLPHTVTTMPETAELQHAVDRLHRDVTPTRAAMPRWIADAAVVVTAWPRTRDFASSDFQPDHTEEHLDAAVQAAISLIENRLDQPPSLEDLAKAAHLSARQLSRRFHRHLGRTPHHYITERRIARARTLLFDERLQGSEIAESLGFKSHAAFSRWFRQHEGRTPNEFRADPSRF